MGISRWLFNDWYTAHELNELERRHNEVQKTARESRQELRDQIADARSDMAALALLTRSLAELCLERGVLSRDELKQRMLALDIIDGRMDGGLDPKLTVPGASKPPAPPPKPKGPTIPPRKGP